MNSIGGNVFACIESQYTSINDIGEKIQGWTPYRSVIGFLDYTAGETNRTSFNSKIQESTHIFLTDYFAIDPRMAERTRMRIGHDYYDITLIDDPMGLHEHIEIYLKFTGGA